MTSPSASRTPAPTGRLPASRRLSRRARRVWLTIHVGVSVAWIGIEACILLLTVVGLTTDDRATLRASFIALGVLGSGVTIPVAVITLVSGVVLSVRTTWGLVQHWWIVIKLALTVALTAGSTLLLNGRLREAADRASALPEGTISAGDIGWMRFQILSSTIVVIAALVAATVLSVFKPVGRTPWGRGSDRARARGPRRATPPAGAPPR